MTNERFYGEELVKMKRTEEMLRELVEEYAEVYGVEEIKPVVYFCSRIKSPESALRKCGIQGFDTSLEGAMQNLYDLVGVRVVCAFGSDVYHFAEWLQRQSEVRVVQVKDYYSNPKPNGYRSYHMQLIDARSGIHAEVQVRTIASDFWATLEHQLKYKKEILNENLIRDELKRCADEIASVDISMQTIREIIRDSLATGSAS